MFVFFPFGRYHIQDKHYTLAVTIPQQQDPNTLYKVLEGDKPEDVKKSVYEDKVYEGTRMIFSVPIKPDHAERLVLQKLSSLRKYTKNNFLLIYSYLSPCCTCTDRKREYNILELIERDVRYWTDGAFVFTRVFDQPKSEHSTREIMIHSLYEVGCSMGGLKYIFRCDGPSNSQSVTAAMNVSALQSSVLLTALSLHRQEAVGQTPRETEAEVHTDSLH